MATKVEHTPGPWTKGPGIITAWDHAVASYTGNGVIRYASSEDEREANARLIAAAPDYHENMLYLDIVMPDVDGPDPFDVKDDDDVVTVRLTARAVRDIRAAVAKATKTN